jgi:hypothetical protein
MIGRILALAIGVLSGLAASQAPEFAQQYRQRIGGAIDELRRVVTRFDESAQASGLSRDEAIARLGQQTDPVAQRQGPAMAEISERLSRLERQRDAAVDAGPFARIAVLARGFDPGLARATYLDFEPAWPATSEGLVIGGSAFVLGWGGCLVLFRALGRLRPSRFARSRRGALRAA